MNMLVFLFKQNIIKVINHVCEPNPVNKSNVYFFEKQYNLGDQSDLFTIASIEKENFGIDIKQ